MDKKSVLTPMDWPIRTKHPIFYIPRLVGAFGLIAISDTDLQTLRDSFRYCFRELQEMSHCACAKNEAILSPHGRKPDNI